MADRSFEVTLHNTVNPTAQIDVGNGLLVVRLTATFSLQGTHLDHGIWSPAETGDRVPPHDIHPQDTVSFANESDGAGTGAQGWVVYSVTGTATPVDGGRVRNFNAGTFTVGWDNPFIGGNSFTCSKNGGDRGYSIDLNPDGTEHPRGNNTSAEAFIGVSLHS